MYFGLTVFAAVAALTNAADIVRGLAERKEGTSFELTATLSTPCDLTGVDNAIALVDSSGAVIIGKIPEPHRAKNLAPGSRLHVKGLISPGRQLRTPELVATVLEVLGQGDAPRPASVSLADFYSGDCDSRLVSLSGTVYDAFRDEIDSHIYCLSVRSDADFFYASLCLPENQTLDCTRLLNAQVRVTGVCSNDRNSYRTVLGRHLRLPSPQHIEVLRVDDNPFDVPAPDLDDISEPREVLRLGRRRTTGRVLAVWQGKNILLRSEGGSLVVVRTGGIGKLPSFGQTIEAVGQTSTDLYHLWLTGAIWREIPGTRLPPPAATDESARRILCNTDGRPCIQPAFDGRQIRLTGILQAPPSDSGGNGTVYIDDSGFLIPVDVSENPSVLDRLVPGATVRLSGTCVLIAEEWHPFATYPHTQGVLLVVRSPDDLAVVSLPSWWTRQRLLAAVAILVLSLVLFFIWNRMLRRLIDRRSRQLFREEIALARANIHTEERTRFAADLHDSISQSLTGLAGHVSAALKTLDTDPPLARKTLVAADGMLKVCRTDLRQCLHDLRSDILEEPDFANAIRQTIEPILGDAKLLVRFPVPRAKFLDSTAHAIFCILRELAGNARNHGHAASVRIAGSLEPDRLLLSVTDDGSGFDPKTRPGSAEGHFGLDGILNRTRRLGGSLTLESSPGKGTRAVIEIPLSHNIHE